MFIKVIVDKTMSLKPFYDLENLEKFLEKKREWMLVMNTRETRET